MKNLNLVLIIALFILVSLNIFNHKEHQKEYQELKISMEEGLTEDEAKEIVNLMQRMTTIIKNNKENIMENRVEINQNIKELNRAYKAVDENLELINGNVQMITKITNILTN